MTEDRMEAFKGEPGDGKDATFQGAGRPQAIASGDHDGRIRGAGHKRFDHGAQLTEGAMEDTRPQGVLRTAGNEGGRSIEVHHWQPGAVRMHATHAHLQPG
jgi:hypothetical protein